MNPDEILRLAAQALSSLDYDALVSLYSKDFLFEDPSLGDTIQDRQQLRDYFRNLFSLPGIAFTNVSFYALGNHGAGEWTWSGISPHTGRPYTIRGASLFELTDAGIKRETIFYDPTSFRG